MAIVRNNNGRKVNNVRVRQQQNEFIVTGTLTATMAAMTTNQQ